MSISHGSMLLSASLHCSCMHQMPAHACMHAEMKSCTCSSGALPSGKELELNDSAHGGSAAKGTLAAPT